MNLWRLPETFYVDEINESPNHCPLNVEDVISINPVGTSCQRAGCEGEGLIIMKGSADCPASVNFFQHQAHKQDRKLNSEEMKN